MRFSDVLLGWTLGSDLAVYTLHRRPAATVHWLAVVVGVYFIVGLWRLARRHRRWDFAEFGPGPWTQRDG